MKGPCTVGITNFFPPQECVSVMQRSQNPYIVSFNYADKLGPNYLQRFVLQSVDIYHRLHSVNTNNFALIWAKTVWDTFGCHDTRGGNSLESNKEALDADKIKNLLKK